MTLDDMTWEEQEEKIAIIIDGSKVLVVVEPDGSIKIPGTKKELEALLNKDNLAHTVPMVLMALKIQALRKKLGRSK